jgi:hypothetical protein
MLLNYFFGGALLLPGPDDWPGEVLGLFAG